MTVRSFRILALVVALSCSNSMAQERSELDTALADDLELLQGSWELLHGNEGKGAPTVRSVKTIEGNVETLRRFNLKTGKKTHEHSVEFNLSKSGNVHVMTFFSVGGKAENGLSYVYKVDKDNFWDIPGLLRGDEYRNYQKTPKIWHWKRVVEIVPPKND